MRGILNGVLAAALSLPRRARKTAPFPTGTTVPRPFRSSIKLIDSSLVPTSHDLAAAHDKKTAAAAGLETTSVTGYPGHPATSRPVQADSSRKLALGIPK